MIAPRTTRRNSPPHESRGHLTRLGGICQCISAIIFVVLCNRCENDELRAPKWACMAYPDCQKFGVNLNCHEKAVTKRCLRSQRRRSCTDSCGSGCYERCLSRLSGAKFGAHEKIEDFAEFQSHNAISREIEWCRLPQATEYVRRIAVHMRWQLGRSRA